MLDDPAQHTPSRDAQTCSEMDAASAPGVTAYLAAWVLLLLLHAPVTRTLTKAISCQACTTGDRASVYCKMTLQRRP
jgi:hypothetical protein